MTLHVGPKISLLTEGLVTFLAFEAFPFHVQLHVIFKMPLGIKCLLALLATEGSLACMGPDVHPQVPPLVELFPTLPARE